MIPVNEPLFLGNEKKYLQDCIDSGWIGTDGPYVKRFEKEFAEYIGREHAIAVSSGTGALDAAVEALGITAGDEVICPTFAIISTINQILRVGAKPVFVDCDRTWNMDVSKVRDLINDKTKAIMCVHIYGLPMDVDSLLGLGLPIIEDAAEVCGQTYKGRKCGTFGKISCFSFYSNKILTTGEGGMILTDDDKLAEKCKSLRNLCHGKQRFHHERLGWNYRMTNLQAAVGCAQLERIEQSINNKRMIGRWYNSLLTNLPVQKPIDRTDYAVNIYWVYPIVTEKPARDVIEGMRKLGVDCRPFFWPLHLQPVVDCAESYPNAEHAAGYGLYLPSGMALSIEQVCDVVNALRKVLCE